jgi:hypothetical protein
MAVSCVLSKEILISYKNWDISLPAERLPDFQDNSVNAQHPSPRTVSPEQATPAAVIPTIHGVALQHAQK